MQSPTGAGGGAGGEGPGDPDTRKRVRGPVAEPAPPAGKPPPAAAPLADGAPLDSDGDAALGLGGGVFSLGTSPKDAKGKAPSPVPVADGVASLGAALGQMAIARALSPAGEGSASAGKGTFVFGAPGTSAPTPPAPAAPGTSGAAKVEGGSAFGLQGLAPAWEGRAALVAKEEALVAEIKALEAELEDRRRELSYQRLELARGDMQAEAQARMLFPEQWRDWAEGLPPGVLEAIGREVVRSEEADFAARRKAFRIEEPPGGQAPAGGEMPAHGLLAFALVCKPWRKTQREIAPLRSRVSDVMAKGSVELAEWAAKLGCPKQGPARPGWQPKPPRDLREMAALCGNVPVLRREMEEWTARRAKQEKERAARDKQEADKKAEAAEKQAEQAEEAAKKKKADEEAEKRKLSSLKARESAEHEKELQLHRLAAAGGSIEVFAFLETSHLFNGFLSWPLTTIDAGRWQQTVGRVTCNFIARNGHIALLEHACLGDVMWKDQSGQFRFKTKFRTPDAVGAAFRAAAEGGHLTICLRLREKYSWEFCWPGSGLDSWLHRNMCEAAAESGSMELCKWLKDDGLSWNWRRVFQGAASGGHLELCKWAVAEYPEAFHLDPDDEDFEDEDFWYGVASSASRNGHLHILRYIESLHGSTSALQYGGVFSAMYAGHVEVLDYLINHCGAHVEGDDCEAAEGLYSFLAFKALYQSLATEWDFDWIFDEYEMCQQLFENAARVGNRDFFEWGRTTGLWDPDYFYECETTASAHGHHDLAAWLERNHYENDLHDCPACSGSGQVMEYMVDEIRGGYA